MTTPIDTPEKRMAYALLETTIFRHLYPTAAFRIWTAFNLAIKWDRKSKKVWSGRANARILVSLPPLPESDYVIRRADRS